MAVVYDLYATLIPVMLMERAGDPCAAAVAAQMRGPWELRPAHIELKHRVGRFEKHGDALKAMSKTLGVWYGGDAGPRTRFFPQHSICHFDIEAVGV